jgi:hypothetical protein
MEITKDNLLFSIYHRPNMFYEDSLHRLLDAGFQIIVLNTGVSSFYPDLKLRHPRLVYIKTSPTSYDGGMMELHRAGVLNQFGAKNIVHIDNDLFLSGTNEIKEYLEEFEVGQFDFAGHLVSQAVCNQYNYGSRQLALVDNLQITTPSNPDDIPTPIPHWETSFMILKLSLWNDLTTAEVGHMRRFVVGMATRKARMASHRATYRWDYSAWGQEWFHLGHIMEKYYRLENNTPFSYDPTGSFDKFRIGWFLYHDKIYPDSDVFTHPHVRERLEELMLYFGGKKIVAEAFTEIAQDTPLGKWQRYE